MRPTLLNSCAAATTAAEARFRIDAKPGLRVERSTRVVALDAGASEIVRPLADQPWLGARFLYQSVESLNDELADADFVLMIATNGDGAAAAAAIGDVCVLRGIMTAGLVLGSEGSVAAAVTALRPHSRVLLVSKDRRDASGLLTALGA
ncbi:MAG TPA: hypothetical protein VGM75_26500 [Pseudonocardiaceae bacterium]|jgi:hypothetical protein